MQVRLRSDVEVRRLPEGIELIDHATGLQLELEGDFGQLDEGARVEPSSEPWVTFRALGLLDEALPLETIRQRQYELRVNHGRQLRVPNVRELLAFANEHVPYYRARAEVYAPDALEDEADLARLPLMDKATLRAEFPAGLVAEGIDVMSMVSSGALEFAATSGTTGERLQVLADMELSSVPDNYERLWNLAPSEQVPRTAVFTTPVCLGAECHLGKAPFEKRLRGGTTLYLNSLDDLFSMKKDLVLAIAEELERFAPQFLLVNPFYLHWLGRRARELDVPLPSPKLVLTCYQYLSRLQKRAISELFSAPVYGYYFATDLSGCRIAIECPRGRWHVREDHVLLEVVGPNGPKASGELGTFALTAHANRVMPLVRYVVGDVGRLTNEACDCAVSAWETVELHGRLKDMIAVDGRWLTTRQIDDVVANIAGIDFYKLTQTGRADAQLEVVPALGTRFDPALARKALFEGLGLESVKVREVSRLDPEPSLKFRISQSKFVLAPELF